MIHRPQYIIIHLPHINMLLVLSLVALFTQSHSYPRYLPLGVLLRPSDREASIEDALQFAVMKHNQQMNHNRKFNITLNIQYLSSDPQDTWHIMKATCDLLKTSGFFIMLSMGDHGSHATFSSIASSMHIPYINWAADNVYATSKEFEVQIRPPTDELLAHLINDIGWDNITYIHDQQEDVINLNGIYATLKKLNDTRLLQSEMLRLPRDEKDFESFIESFHRARYLDHTRDYFRVLLDASTYKRQRLILNAIAKSPLKTDRFYYVVSNYDISQPEMDRFSHGILNITGLELIDQDHQQMVYQRFRQDFALFVRERQGTDAHIAWPDVALAYDSVHVALQALEATLQIDDSLFINNFRNGEVWNADKRGIYCNPEEAPELNRPFEPFEHGLVIAEKLKQVNMRGLTGHIQFHKNGIRKNFTVVRTDITFSKRTLQFKEQIPWKQGIGYNYSNTKFWDSRIHVGNNTSSLQNKTWIITTVTSKPFAYPRLHENGSQVVVNGHVELEGYCVDLVKLLQTRIDNFRVHMRLVFDGSYGSERNGKWNGMIGELLTGKADMAIAPLTINRQRERVVDFSKPFMTTGISIMIKKPDKQEFSVFSFMQPLSSEIWMYIAFAYIGVSVVIFLVSRFSPYEWRVEEMANGGFTISNDFSVYNCLWFTLAAFMQQGTDILPRSVSGRIASSAWWFFTMIMVSSYTANLAAFLTLEKMQAPIESVEDLAKQTKIKYGIQEKGSTENFFRDSTVQIYQRMWQYMYSQQPSVFTSTYEEGIKRVRDTKGRYAFLLESTVNEFYNTRKPCNTMKVGQNLNSLGYGIATPFGSAMKDPINLAILDLQEKGELKKLENKWWYDRGECEQGIADSQSASLNLSKVAGIFYILMAGMIVAMVAAMCEFLYRSRIEARKGKRGLGSSMRAQLQLSVQGEKAAKGLLT